MATKQVKDTVSPLYPTRSATGPNVAAVRLNARAAAAIALYTAVRRLTTDSVATTPPERMHLEIGDDDATPTGRSAPASSAAPPKRRRRHRTEYSG